MIRFCEVCDDESDSHADNHECEGDIRLRVAALETEVRELREALAHLRRDMNHQTDPRLFSGR